MNAGTFPGAGRRKNTGPMRPPQFEPLYGNYTFVANDAGRGFYGEDSAYQTWTIPRDTFVEGDMIWVTRRGSPSYYILINPGSGVTLYLAGSTSSGSRRVVTRGMGAIYFESPNVAVLYGSGIG